MTEINSILKAFAEYRNSKSAVFLATVVRVQGSSYGQPGARMLMKSGEMVGSVSGGCLEQDILEHTRVSMSENKPIVITYDNTTDEDLLWGFGLGCNGVIKVLIEKLNQDDLFNPLKFIYNCFEKQQLGIMARIVDVEGTIKTQVGAHLTLASDGAVETNIQDEELNDTLLKEAKTCLENQHSSFHIYQFSLGKVEVFLELIEPPPHLMIFGAGRDVFPVVNFAKALGWQITIVDCRANTLSKERFMLADEIILTRREILHQHLFLKDQTIALLMTHNYLDDLEILKALMGSKIKYIGCLGSQRRKAKLLEDLRRQGFDYSAKMLDKLYCPVGIDIGAKTPDAIALSIIAEIQGVLSHRQGGFLKQRSEPIHQPNAVKEIQLNESRI
ncbi:MAG: XdhC family protein [Crocosphaera sp.]|nr:XdhC family protein [Crocosphaera sp.]